MKIITSFSEQLAGRSFARWHNFDWFGALHQIVGNFFSWLIKCFTKTWNSEIPSETLAEIHFMFKMYALIPFWLSPADSWSGSGSVSGSGGCWSPWGESGLHLDGSSALHINAKRSRGPVSVTCIFVDCGRNPETKLLFFSGRKTYK